MAKRNRTHYTDLDCDNGSDSRSYSYTPREADFSDYTPEADGSGSRSYSYTPREADFSDYTPEADFSDYTPEPEEEQQYESEQFVDEEDDLDPEEIEDESDNIPVTYRRGVSAVRDYPDFLKIDVRFNGGKTEHEQQKTEQEQSRKRMKVDDEDLWRECPFVEESLKLEQFSKHFLPNCGLRMVKERLGSEIGFKKEVERLEIQWRKLNRAESRVDLMRAELILAQSKLILRALE